MNQTFGCIVIQKEKKFLSKDTITKSISELGLKASIDNSSSYTLDHYLLSNNIKDNHLYATEIHNLFVLLGHPLYYLLNEETLGKVQRKKRTLFHFTQHGKSREYGYKFYQKGELCTHEICFGENSDLYYKSPIQNGIKLPQSIHRDHAFHQFTNEKQIPIELLNTLRASLPRNGMSSVFFHPKKQEWIYGKLVFQKNSENITVTNFQELAPQGHKRGKPILVDSKAVEKGLLIRWEQLFYEWHHRTIKELLGFRFDYPNEYPNNIKLTKYELLS